MNKFGVGGGMGEFVSIGLVCLLFMCLVYGIGLNNIMDVESPKRCKLAPGVNCGYSFGVVLQKCV